jgi:hypothetical protein
MNFSLSIVRNVNAEYELQARPMGNTDERSHRPAIARFRRHIMHLLSDTPNTLEKVVALRRWTRGQQSDDRHIWLFPASYDSGQTDPELLLQEQHARQPGACRRFAWVLAGALVSAGVNARVVSMADGFDDKSTNHVLTEAWIPELDKWLLVDATSDTLFRVDGKYASLVELRHALLHGAARKITFERNGSSRHPAPSVKYYAALSKHIFFSQTNAVFSTASFPVLNRPLGISYSHLTDEVAPPYPQTRKAMLLATALMTFFLAITSAAYRLRQYVKCHPGSPRGTRTPILAGASRGA